MFHDPSTDRQVRQVRHQKRPQTVPVVLVVPPVINPCSPTLGTALLAAACKREGIGARVYHANVGYAGRVGFELCMRLAVADPYCMLSEAVFWREAFPESTRSHASILDKICQLKGSTAQMARLQFPTSEEVRFCVSQVRPFLEETAERVLSYSPAIVGISSMCQQTHASLALAREIKRRRPNVIVVLGGINAWEPWGEGILRQSGAFDFVFSGEADRAFPFFCRAFMERGELPQERLIRCRPVDNLDDVPPPDYSCYFEDIAPWKDRSPLAAEAPSWLIFESSRGCWKGAHSNCRFCNWGSTTYRAKSPDRILEEISDLTGLYSPRKLLTSDFIMPRNLPASTFGRMKPLPEYSIRYLVPSTIDETDLRECARAGVDELQPGIETLSSNVLRLMSKGVSALQNITLLRDAVTCGITLRWNFLTGIPGEEREDYERMLGLLPLLLHLPPPIRWGPIRIVHGSPYHAHPDRYGITGLRPWPAYREFYGEDAERFARYFEAEYQTGFTRNPELVDRFCRAIRRWADAWLSPSVPPRLSLHPLADGRAAIRDTRPGSWLGFQILTSELLEVLRMLKRAIPVEKIPEESRSALATLVESRLVACHEGEYLALPTESRPTDGQHTGSALIGEDTRAKLTASCLEYGHLLPE